MFWIVDMPVPGTLRVRALPLFCLPHAGGAAMPSRRWAGSWFGVLQLPERAVQVEEQRQAGIRRWVDRLVWPEWQCESRCDFSRNMLERHHFFMRQQERRVLCQACRCCERHLRQWRLGSQRSAG